MTAAEFGLACWAHVEHLRRRARSLCGRSRRGVAIEPDDVVSDTMLRAMEQRGKFTAGSDLSAWLSTILKRQFLDMVRAGSVRVRLSDRAAAAVNPSDPAPPAAKIDAGAVWRAAATSLPAAQLEVLRTRYVELEPEYHEIATVLTIPIGTVMSQLHRAHRTLRTVLEAEAQTTE